MRCERSPPKASRTHAHRTAHTAAAEAPTHHVSRALRCGQGPLLDDQQLKLLFSQTDDVGSAAGEEMVLDVYEGPNDDLGCVGTRVTCACGWRIAFGRAVCTALRTEREGPRRGQ